MRGLNAVRRLATVIGASAVVLVPLGLGGCASGPPCLPAPLHVDPPAAAAGQHVTLSAAPAACDLGYGADHAYSLSTQTHGAVRMLPAIRVHADGSFSAVITVPADTPRGSAEIVAGGSPFDDCADTGSCAGYATSLDIR